MPNFIKFGGTRATGTGADHDQMDVWVKLNERKKSEEIRELLGLEPVSLMITL